MDSMISEWFLVSNVLPQTFASPHAPFGLEAVSGLEVLLGHWGVVRSHDPILCAAGVVVIFPR